MSDVWSDLKQFSQQLYTENDNLFRFNWTNEGSKFQTTNQCISRAGALSGQRMRSDTVVDRTDTAIPDPE